MITCQCPVNADDFDTLEEVALCGKPATVKRIIVGIAFDMCAECVKKYDDDVIERARDLGFEWRETSMGAEVVANEIVVKGGTRPACVEWLASILPEYEDLEIDTNAN